jgi:hypothetical protein
MVALVAMRTRFTLRCLLALLLLGGAVSPLAGQAPAPAGTPLVLSGDLVYFFGMGRPNNCFMSNRYKRGEPVGFRMTAIDPATGRRVRNAQLVVHLSYGGKTIDVPMRDRQTDTQPEREFFVAKWVVPEDAPVGVVRYTVSAKDPQGRTGEWKPFEVAASQLTIIE